MLEKLTPEQEATFPYYVDKWLKIGTDTTPLDFERAKEALLKLYDVAGYARPANVYRYRSPIEAAYGAALYEKTGEYHEFPLEHPFKDTLDAAKAFANFEYGFNSCEFSRFDFFARETDVEGLEAVAVMEEVAETCGWYASYEDVAFIQEKPLHILFDNNKLLHCQTGPAILYSDGFAVYAWHGTRVPAEWIEDKSTITPEVMLKWPNVEQRRCAIEIVGWAEALKLMDCKVINVHPNPLIGSLLEVTIPEIGVERFLKVECGTGRTFAIPVHPETKTALAAQAAIQRCTEEDVLNLQVRT